MGWFRRVARCASSMNIERKRRDPPCVGQDALEDEDLVGALGPSLLGEEDLGHPAGAQAPDDLELRDLPSAGDGRGCGGRGGPGHAPSARMESHRFPKVESTLALSRRPPWATPPSPTRRPQRTARSRRRRSSICCSTRSRRSSRGRSSSAHAGQARGRRCVFVAGQPAKVRTSEPVAYLGRVLLELGYLDRGAGSTGRSRSWRSRRRPEPGSTATLLVGTGHHRRARSCARASPSRSRASSGTRRRCRPTRPTATTTGSTRWQLGRAERRPRRRPVSRASGACCASIPRREHVQRRDARRSGILHAAPVRGAEVCAPGPRGRGDSGRRAAARSGPCAGRRAGQAPDGSTTAPAQLLAYLLLVTKQVDVLAPTAVEPRVRPSGRRGALVAPSDAAAAYAFRPHEAAKLVRSARRRPAPFEAAAIAPPGSGRRVPRPPRASRRSSPRAGRRSAERAATIDRADYFIMLDLARDATPRRSRPRSSRWPRAGTPTACPPSSRPCATRARASSRA